MTNFDSFVSSFPDSVQMYVKHFTNNARGYEMCKKVVLAILNNRGYNLSPIKGQFQTNLTLEQLYQALIIESEKVNLFDKLCAWLLKGILLSLLCYVLDLDKGVLLNMRESDPEAYEGVFKAMYLTGLHGILQ